MEQQAQLTDAARQQQQQQCSTGTAAITRGINEEAFDSVRQAAVVMFKQRTKDLTRLTQVETQCQAIEAELRQAQTCVTQLMAQQASLEALVEEEQQRTRQRESRLQELHSSLLQLDEEQQTSGKLQRSAEAAIGAATAFIRTFTNADGRLFQLLTMASARTAGRSALELQRLLADVQQALVAAEAHRQGLMCLPSFSLTAEASASGDLRYTAPPSSTAVVSADASTTGVLHALREWADKMDWAQHRELADVVQIMQQLVAWLSAGGSAQEEAQQAVAGGRASYEWGLPWPPLPPFTEEAVTEHHWFGSLSLPSTIFQADIHGGGSAEVAAEDKGTRATLPLEECAVDVDDNVVPSSEVVQLVVQQNLLAPLQAISTYNAHLAAVCAQKHLQLPEDASSLAASLTATKQRWIFFHEAWQQWREEVLKTQAAAEAATAAATELDAAQAALRVLQRNCEEQSHNCASRKKEVASFKETEISHYAAAWSRGVCASQAQRDSFRAVSDAIVSLTKEASALATALHGDSEHHAHETHARDVALAEQQEQLTATRQRVAVAKTRAAALEAECAEAQRVQQLVRDQFDELLSCATRRLQPPPGAAGSNDDGENINEAAPRDLGELPVARCAASVAQKLLRSATACSPAHAAWTERLVELASEVHDVAAGDSNGSLLISSVSQLFANLMDRCGGGQAAGSESGSEPTLDAAAVRLAIQDTVAGLRLPSDLFLDVVDAELMAQVPYLRTWRSAEQAIRASVDEHRVFMCDATAEISILRSELATAEE
ncbi:conserved hypothetical protein [Leishmania infantum JPCM5]|uniref:Uncharacterized protein n=2 Tax=Leishmania infantum TaxID=5671 RepID=A4I0P1_LEIIN|nr:conserved hypothetical protein [Leishmania infantum JPCM5]CAC9491135.1 hypothetical_protein_-_conserved [Leishmania infantum]CAM68313.1 conserved hypothetical protein [Leishmania infantum JPCM5]SUZ42131.1 hypothetical_protein_-_conserved [Leishmania infantum]|eukprot:XP_001465882.1 conserved hypothetical protein [Leishmania infantum JPCM5]